MTRFAPQNRVKDYCSSAKGKFPFVQSEFRIPQGWQSLTSGSVLEEKLKSVYFSSLTVTMMYKHRDK